MILYSEPVQRIKGGFLVQELAPRTFSILCPTPFVQSFKKKHLESFNNLWLSPGLVAVQVLVSPGLILHIVELKTSLTWPRAQLPLVDLCHFKVLFSLLE